MKDVANRLIDDLSALIKQPSALLIVRFNGSNRAC